MLVIVSPPSLGGVRDYSLVLCDELNCRGYKARVVYGEPEIDFAAPGDDVLLQYSGYGFARRGAPLWLLRSVREQRTRWRSFGMYFHELYAFGAPWTSAFWLCVTQRRIVTELIELADYWFTNRQASFDWLAKRGESSHGRVLNICSTIGEPRTPRLLGTRTGDAIVFGSAGLRRATYARLDQNDLRALLSTGARLHDVGNPLDDHTSKQFFRMFKVIEHGRLSSILVGQLLSNARYGLLAYSKEFVAKSSVFAAYCAFGLVPVLFSSEHGDADGLQLKRNYLPGLELDLSSDRLIDDLIRQEAVDWYRAHSVGVHAEQVQNAIARFTGNR